ncbi:hypothetical protein EA796_20675, partial [Pseudomonas sp. AOB-7]|uniref:hypothetical protein n=1 Tax=Pseudomonas sp. AOB-7 TaxID=2482750 RepID=UPI000F1EB81E
MFRMTLWLALLLFFGQSSHVFANDQQIRRDLLDIERNLLLHSCTGSTYFLGTLKSRHAALHERLADHANAHVLLDILELFNTHIAQAQHAVSQTESARRIAMKHALQVSDLFSVYLPAPAHFAPASLADNLRSLARLRIHQTCGIPPVADRSGDAEPRLRELIEQQIKRAAPPRQQAQWAVDWRYLQLGMPSATTLLYPFGSQIERLIRKAERLEASPSSDWSAPELVDR